VLENLALGAEESRVKFYNNSHSDMSSVLPMAKEGWGTIHKESEVVLTTADQYCQRNALARIHLLKCDTQGFELEVLKGAERMLNQTGLVLLEINFAELYQGQPSFSEIYDFLTKRNFRLVKLFHMKYDQKYVTMADALFANTLFH
jgi:hypothetical protein